ncbi:hypothetical protein [Actibacterium mucosum]|nr:hypothetical protein [Actibacterium mucosum]
MPKPAKPRGQLAHSEWYAQLEKLGADHGGFDRLGDAHCALYLEDSPTLLVTFECGENVRARAKGRPMGWTIAEEAGWSQLSLIAEGSTWFRSPQVYGYFDELVDDGFFDDFERVVFFGAGDCGYAAAAFSVAAPGSTVVLVNPQATLDPRVTEWDPRFTAHRRISFTDRYGYAPDMLEASERAYVMYDPEATFDAMHTALFTRKNVTKLRCRHLGPKLADELDRMGVLSEVIDAACEGMLTDQVFHRLFRTRRDNPRYLRRLLDKTETAGHPYLAAMLCRNVISRHRAPRFRRRLNELQETLAAEGRALPPLGKEAGA